MNRFNNIVWSPLNDEVSVIAHEASAEMLSRLEWVTLQPKCILDAGCGVASMSLNLKKRYPQANVFALDLSQEMLNYAKTNHQDALNYICADAAKLPFKDETVDLIAANLLWPWHGDVEALLKEWQRVLHPEGLLMFTAFGPDTLRECSEVLLPHTVDMHDIGDLLLRLGFADPVLDVNYYTVSYRNQEKMLQEMSAFCMISSSEVGKNLLPDKSETWQITYEIIYAHTFMPEKKITYSAEKDGSVRIPLAQLRSRLKSSG